ncbi:hypothetical protein COX69_03150 [Candidatus Falkowbacteria bacterium CG_4_10_14_0_2_um_filter_48_10]|uniref:HTH arsR-type domain-containing protein n=1 Tax=Candidatus Falkowbacteria bacterium CG23_combo_of_CG06-09_8_20_14_all_49_15 TaxID=1974572 RepID=A0A2G9ZLV2_9BACT|nr:MAG: hypothetical protein COX22_00455 [Candidatus Falkowbacteria bacterium CG23_combo_of_CG06-09_8_20_14_all_49_15]PJA08100.1 MAG: hypothetical protein COX69_03150 [Candidatus Falkowbacteria bacterium CG_4_10_14_0_2_um_filter_48_10]
MLNRLFGSKTRLKLLKHFILHPQEKLYIRQIARQLKLQLNAVRRELDNLEKFGLLASSLGKGESRPISAEAVDNPENPGPVESQANNRQEKKFYLVNPDFILLEELKSLVVKAQILYERDFIEKVKRAGVPKLLVFSGFFVNNTFSPVDLLAVGQFNKPRLVRIINELENELGKDIRFTILGNREFKYRRDITDVFLYNILEGKKIVAIDEFGIS